MGFLSRLFSTYNEFEESLLHMYTAQLTSDFGGDANKAAEMAKNLLDKSIQAAKRDGTYDLPPDLGNILLKIKPTTDPLIQKRISSFEKQLSMLRKEGITDDDIRTWWNLNAVERKIVIMYDTFSRLAGFVHHLQEGKSPKEAGYILRKNFPIYGGPNDEADLADPDLKGNNRRLPMELKDRVNRHGIRRFEEGADQYHKDVEQCSSYNAFIRKEIRAGRL